MLDATQYETLNNTIRTAARMVLESPLADTLNNYSRTAAENAAAAEEIAYLNLEFHLRGESETETSETYCTLYVKYDGWSWDTTTHEDGSIWRTYATEITVNWPCHGASSPEIARKRTAFYDRVIELADGIKSTIQTKVDVCIRTAEEQAKLLEEQAARAAQINLENTLKAAANVVRKGMRVDSARPVPSALLPDVAPGAYDIVCLDYNGKVERKFHLYVDQDTGALLTRLS